MSTTVFDSNDFSDLLQASLKPVPKKTVTFFDLAGFPHYENVMSNFYAYFMSPVEQHGLGDLFLSCINNILSRKKDNLTALENLQACFVEREVCTDSGKFIDLVVYEKTESGKKTKNALIIENKVNAIVYNDLPHYYNFVKAENKKTGVVLSLYAVNGIDSNFINITHLELVNEIEKAPGTFFLNIDPKQLFILKEFIQNIKSMSQHADLKEHYVFFIRHKEKIKKLNELYETIQKDIYQQAEAACEKLNMGLELRANYSSRLRYYVSTKTPEVYFTILLENVISKNKLSIFVELSKDGIQYIDAINAHMAKQLDGTRGERVKTRESYLHYAWDEYELADDDLENLTAFICRQINESPLKKIFEGIETCITGEKTGKAWR